MKLLIAQPYQETNVKQLREDLSSGNDFDTVLYPEGYLSSEDLVEKACKMASEHRKNIITGYRDKNRKDRALVINNEGAIILDRAKTLKNEKLNRPSSVSLGKHAIGFLLCVELLQAFQELESQVGSVDFIAHPIGVGMFSDEQFDEWISEAKKIAVKYNTFVIGTSHADGSYKNCGVSIPISYCVNNLGESVFVSKNDLRSRIVDITSMDYRIVQNNNND